jgi:hypothetical protein
MSVLFPAPLYRRLPQDPPADNASPGDVDKAGECAEFIPTVRCLGRYSTSRDFWVGRRHPVCRGKNFLIRH